MEHLAEAAREIELLQNFVLDVSLDEEDRVRVGAQHLLQILSLALNRIRFLLDRALG